MDSIFNARVDDFRLMKFLLFRTLLKATMNYTYFRDLLVFQKIKNSLKIISTSFILFWQISFFSLVFNF